MASQGLPEGAVVKPIARIQGLPEGAVVKPLENPQPNEGEQSNELGKTVIVPKDGESFSDTLARAAEHGKSVSQQDINEEMATAPGKAAQVLTAAPVIGAGGAAALAAPGELGSAAAKIPSAAENILHISEQALEHLAENYPHLAKLADKLGYGAGVIGAYKLLKKLDIN
jgi:hypothetical protein